jgi:hypothetical protein
VSAVDGTPSTCCASCSTPPKPDAYLPSDAIAAHPAPIYSLPSDSRHLSGQFNRLLARRYPSWPPQPQPSCSSPRSWVSRLPANTPSRNVDLPDAAPTVDRERPGRE